MEVACGPGCGLEGLCPQVGEAYGVGTEIAIRYNGLHVRGPEVLSPADQAGGDIVAGDEPKE